MSKSKTEKNVDQILNSLPTISAKIRYLDSIEMSRGDISRKLNKRYQHVRNVLITPVKNPKV